MNKKAVNLNPSTLSAIRHLLLEWYAKNRRSLPWRALKGEIPNPYYVYLSEIMLQQTTVATVFSYFQRFIKKWPLLSDLASSSLDELLVEWQGLGYYSRARNMHHAVKELNALENFPSTPEQLKNLPGVGDYTAAAIASIAFDYPIVPVDGNVIRVFSRLFSLETSLSALRDEVWHYAQAFNKGQDPGDFAQGLMDLGSLVCRPKQPNCHLCPLTTVCTAYAQGQSHEFPKTQQKVPKPIRYGTVFALFNKDNRLLLEKRPGKGLLGGMMGLPGTPWEDSLKNCEAYAPQKNIAWQTSPLPVKHTFTHFHLYLTVKRGMTMHSPEGIWVKEAELSAYALPTLMKKAIQKIKEV